MGKSYEDLPPFAQKLVLRAIELSDSYFGNVHRSHIAASFDGLKIPVFPVTEIKPLPHLRPYVSNEHLHVPTNTLGITHLHGTKSGNLPLILRYGLLTAAILRRMKLAPMGGELAFNALQQGPNVKHISAAPIMLARGAVEYASRHSESLTPLPLARLRAKRCLHEASIAADIEGQRMSAVQFKRALRELTSIFVKRAEQYLAFSPDERECVDKSFPVLVAITNARPRYEFRGMPGLEYGLLPCKPEDLYILIPESKIELVNRIATSTNSPSRIKPLHFLLQEERGLAPNHLGPMREFIEKNP